MLENDPEDKKEWERIQWTQIDNNLYKMGKFFRHKLSLIQEETRHLNSPIAIRKIAFVTKTFPQRRLQTLITSVIHFVKHLRKYH